jgi:hypothetical protein
MDLEIDSPLELEIMISDYEVAFLNTMAKWLPIFLASSIFEKWEN